MVACNRKKGECGSLIKTLYICDRCEKQVSDLRSKVEFNFIEPHRYNYDLCKDCAARLVEFMEEILHKKAVAV